MKNDSGNHIPGDKLPVEAVQPQWTNLPQMLGDANGNLFDSDTRGQKNIVEYFRAILYRKWLVAGVFVLVLGIAIAYAYGTTPYYVSSSTIEIEKVYPSSASLSELFAFFGQFDLYLQTQLESLKSRNLAEKFLIKTGKLTPASTSEATKAGPEEMSQPSDENPEHKTLFAEERKRAGLISSVLGRVTVTPVKGTQLIQIDMGANDPLIAQKSLDYYVVTFIEEDRRKRQEIASKVKNWLMNELKETDKQLKDSEAKLMDFTREHGIVYFDKRPGLPMSLYEKAGEALLQSKDNRVNLEALEQNKTTALPPQITNESLQALKSQLAALKSEYTSMKAIYSPDYFKMGLIRSKIQAMEEAIAGIEKETLSSAVEAAKKKEELTGEVFEQSKQSAMNLNSLAVQYEILKRMVDAYSQAYIMLLQKSKQAELDHGFMGHNISVMSSATLPFAPVYPVKSKVILVGAIIGLIGGIGLALVLDFMDNSAQSVDTLEKTLNIPILGTIPKIKNAFGYFDSFRGATMDPRISTVEFAAHRFPTSAFTDAVRVVQNAASAMVSGESGNTMCVSSALPLEGKTLIAVVMGTVIASENKKVLIIDGDLRRPRIHQVFKVNNTKGFSDLITGKCFDIKEVVKKSPVPNLYYMVSGSSTDNPVALLKSDRAQDVLEACRNIFDYIIIDAPPVLGLVDAPILSSYSDGIILVAKAGYTPIDVLRQAKDSIFRGRGRLLGMVLNMVDHKSAGYYKSYGHYGYGYHQYHSKRSS